MGYVRSRKFCCCLPVRFGVFCMSLLGLVGGVLFSVGGFINIHQYMTNQLDLNGQEKASLWIMTLAFSWFSLVSLVGIWGSLSKGYGSISFYAYTVTFNTLLIIAAGIYFVWTLFHGREDGSVNKCTAGEDGDLKGVKHWVCQKGFDVIRILIVVLFVLIWIFQLVGTFIVFDYRGQLREEQDLEDSEAQKLAQPNYIVAPPAAPQMQMRTTYDAQPYENNTNGWASAKSPYAFKQPQTAQMGGR
ncbi:hypothetical protein BDW22DRAFT_1338034 [Trametopsis cervina]|nr:hypothetical protein BDW22DRAFT_1338034 [Trametopsis cervina]